MSTNPSHKCAICEVSIVHSNSASPSRFFIDVGRDRSQLGGTDQPCGCNRDVHKGAACLSVQFLESQRTSFKTHNQKEISVCANAFHQKPSISLVYQRIEWFKLTDLPTWKCNKAAPREFCLILPLIVTIEDPPTPFSPFSLANCTMLNHFSFNDFIAIAFPDIAGDLDIQI